MTDEAYVRSVWTPEHLSGWLSRIGERKWSDIAEFTRERLEQVRQLREEMHHIECLLMPPPDTLIREAVDEMWPESMTVGFVREVCAYSRTHARLESALATLTQGMKPDVQP